MKRKKRLDKILGMCYSLKMEGVMTAPDGYVYVPVREHLGVDIDGQIAVLSSELKQETENAENGE